MTDQLTYNIDKKIEFQQEQDIAQNILNDPRVKTVYGE